MKWELKPDKYMSEHEVKGLLKSTEDKALADISKGRSTWVRVWMLIDLVCSSGLRVAEIANLRVRDINLKGREPFINVVDGKCHKQRLVYIPNKLVKHIKEYVKRYDLEPEDYLLTSSHGKAFSRSGLQKHFKTACRVAGLPGHYSIHSARHTYATMLYSQTRDLRLIQRLLGHSSIVTTSVYADCTKGSILQAVNDTF